MQPAARDLFGEIPVTLEELLAWMLAVPGIPPTDARRFAYYVRHWNVIEKIQAAKADGTFEDAISANRTPAAWPSRLAATIEVAEAQRRRYRA
jgi:hypothetical protein